MDLYTKEKINMIMTGFERTIDYVLQNYHFFSRRESEEAIYEMRNGLGVDKIHQIKNGDTGKGEYPTVKAMIWAYYNDGYNAILNQMYGDIYTEDEETEEAEEPEEAEEEKILNEEEERQFAELSKKLPKTKKEKKAWKWEQTSLLEKKFKIYSMKGMQIASMNLYALEEGKKENFISDYFLTKVFDKINSLTWDEAASDLAYVKAYNGDEHLYKVVGEEFFAYIWYSPIYELIKDFFYEKYESWF